LGQHLVIPRKDIILFELKMSELKKGESKKAKTIRIVLNLMGNKEMAAL
jgi:hypothetical protein